MWKAVHVSRVGYIWDISVLSGNFVQTNKDKHIQESFIL